VGKKYLIDTNILIYFLAGTIPENQVQRLTDVFLTSFNISVITKIELLGWRKHSAEGLLKSVEFISNANTIFLDDNIAEQSILLKQKISIKLPDAVIAATCVAKGYTLVTRNTGDFTKIDSLDIFNPFLETH